MQVKIPFLYGNYTDGYAIGFRLRNGRKGKVAIRDTRVKDDLGH